VTGHDGSRPAVGIDASTPNPARIYDALLGGENHFPADRIAAHQLLNVAPQACPDPQDSAGRSAGGLYCGVGRTPPATAPSGLRGAASLHAPDPLASDQVAGQEQDQRWA
jgi:hypothetical protein